MTIMDYFQKSILRQLMLSFFGFGMLMAVVFPYYAGFFVIWKDGMYSWFYLGCIIAGISLGVANYYLVKIILLKKNGHVTNHTTCHQ